MGSPSRWISILPWQTRARPGFFLIGRRGVSKTKTKVLVNSWHIMGVLAFPWYIMGVLAFFIMGVLAFLPYRSTLWVSWLSLLSQEYIVGVLAFVAFVWWELVANGE